MYVAGYGMKDHPRVCGEQIEKVGGNVGFTGSPPRVRGTALSPLLDCTTRRITPACAGNRVGG